MPKMNKRQLSAIESNLQAAIPDEQDPYAEFEQEIDTFEQEQAERRYHAQARDTEWEQRFDQDH